MSEPTRPAGNGIVEVEADDIVETPDDMLFAAGTLNVKLPHRY